MAWSAQILRRDCPCSSWPGFLHGGQLMLTLICWKWREWFSSGLLGKGFPLSSWFSWVSSSPWETASHLSRTRVSCHFSRWEIVDCGITCLQFRALSGIKCVRSTSISMTVWFVLLDKFWYEWAVSLWLIVWGRGLMWGLTNGSLIVMPGDVIWARVSWLLEMRRGPLVLKSGCRHQKRLTLSVMSWKHSELQVLRLSPRSCPEVVDVDSVVVWLRRLEVAGKTTPIWRVLLLRSPPMLWPGDSELLPLELLDFMFRLIDCCFCF